VKDRIEELARECAATITKPIAKAPSRNISETITLAVNEAIELAAKECETSWQMPVTMGGRIERVHCAEAIRKLKVKE